MMRARRYLREAAGTKLAQETSGRSATFSSGHWLMFASHETNPAARCELQPDL